VERGGHDPFVRLFPDRMRPGRFAPGRADSGFPAGNPLGVFPLAPGAEKVIEYALTMATQYREGRDVLPA
jgi:hypothetical protein